MDEGGFHGSKESDREENLRHRSPTQETCTFAREGPREPRQETGKKGKRGEETQGEDDQENREERKEKGEKGQEKGCEAINQYLLIGAVSPLPLEVGQSLEEGAGFPPPSFVVRISRNRRIPA